MSITQAQDWNMWVAVTNHEKGQVKLGTPVTRVNKKLHMKKGHTI